MNDRRVETDGTNQTVGPDDRDPADREVKPASRWRVLFALSAVYASFGFVVAATSALVSPIRADLGLSNAQMGLVLGAWQFSYIASSIPAGRAIDRFGPRRGLAAAAVVIAVSGLGRALAGDFLSLLLAAAVLGLGAPLVSVGSPAVTASLFEGRSRRQAVAVYGTAPAAGSMLGFFLPGSVLMPIFDDDWRIVLLVPALVSVVALAGWLIASRRLDHLIVPGTGPALADYLSIARLPVVGFILVLAMMTFFVMHGSGQWMVAIIESSGRTLAEAGRWATVASIMVLAVSVTVPQITSPRLRGPMMIAAALVGAVAVTGLAAVQAPVLAVSLAAVSWARAGLVPLFMLMLMDHPDVGPSRMAAATGLFFAVAQLGGVSGPAVTGLLSGSDADAADFSSALTVHAVILVGIAVVVAIGLVSGVFRSHSSPQRSSGSAPA